MLAVLDRQFEAWHMWLANGVAVAWFVGMALATQAALPGVKLFRCPIGLCLGYYSPIELQATLTRIGKNGRDFLAETLLPLDMVLPTLLLVAFAVTYVWFSRPGRGVRGAAEPRRPPRVPVRAAVLQPRRLRRELGAGGGPAGLSQHPLLARAPGELPHGHQVAARHRVDRHRHRAGDCRLGRWRSRSAGAAMPPSGPAVRPPLRRCQAPLSTSANTLRAARKHSTPSGTPA